MDKFIGLLGIAVIVGVAVLFSNNRKAINWRTVAVGLAFNFVTGLLILKVPATRHCFEMFGHGINKLLDFAVDGATFVVGDKLAHGEFIFAIRVGSSIILIAALSSLAYYLGIMQRIVKMLAKVLVKAMGITGPEALSSVSAVFVGQVECQVLIKPYMKSLSRSELFTSIAAAMATISGSALVAYTSVGMNPVWLISASIMSVFSGIAIAKIFCPETDKKALVGDVVLEIENKPANAFDAIAHGAMDGAKIAGNVLVMVMVGVAMVAMLNYIVSIPLHWFGVNWEIQDMIGTFLTPVAWLLGVPWHDAFHVARLMATEIFVNEFVSYGELSKVIAGHGAYVLSERTQLIATAALCGFANLGSIAINIGGLGAMAPERRGEIAKIGFRCLIAANFATWITAAMCGLFL
jgi:concentrative nucleoside transporter, CNT family